eukprot:m.357127 g.357127  ORF g.357127 m.357127 type:complete len:69 (-) comp17718_c0_seq1:2202-2408(-)
MWFWLTTISKTTSTRFQARAADLTTKDKSVCVSECCDCVCGTCTHSYNWLDLVHPFFLVTNALCRSPT